MQKNIAKPPEFSGLIRVFRTTYSYGCGIRMNFFKRPCTVLMGRYCKLTNATNAIIFDTTLDQYVVLVYTKHCIWGY